MPPPRREIKWFVQIQKALSDHKKGGSLTSLLRAVYSRVKDKDSFMYPREIFCKDGRRIHFK